MRERDQIKAFKIGMAKDFTHDQWGTLLPRCLYNPNSLISQKQHIKIVKQYNPQLYVWLCVYVCVPSKGTWDKVYFRIVILFM